MRIFLSATAPVPYWGEQVCLAAVVHVFLRSTNSATPRSPFFAVDELVFFLKRTKQRWTKTTPGPWAKAIVFCNMISAYLLNK